MPNHCFNTLTITSNEIENVKKFYSENLNVEEEFCHLSFNKSIPIPEDEKSNWYNWNCENWGTKWDAYEIEINDNDNSIEYYFQTAWSPPTPWLDTVAKKYTNIEFRLEYNEPGCDFGGIITYNNGELTQDDQYNISDYNWEKVDRELLERIINDHFNNSEYDSETDMSDIIEEIYEKYSEEDEYYDNIHSHIEEEISRLINSNVKYALNLDHNDKGKVINNVKL